MKFSWKLFFSTVFITLIVFSVGGYALISMLFSATYDREVANAGEENRILQYSFVAYWNTTATGMNLTRQNVEQTARTMAAQMEGNSMRMRLTDSEGELFFDNTGSEADGQFLQGLMPDQRRHMLRRAEDGGYELLTVSVIKLEDASLYLESVRDMTAIFEEREEQYKIYQKWMTGLLAAEGLCCLLLAAWLMRPVRRLSRTTRRIAKGNLEVRVKVESRDEFGELAEDFNAMADSLERQFQELENAARRQEDFIGSFAHELKTPLTAMIGYADMLRSQEMPREEQLMAANYIFKEGRRLEALSLKLLDLLVAEKQELELRPVGSKWLAEEIRGLLQPQFQRENIKFKVIVEDAVLLLEPDLFKTVLINLLDNARKAMSGREGGVYLLGRREQDGFAYYVRDTGCGIPREELSRITEAFYMVDKSRSRQQGGAGLGLAICARIVERHGGTLKFTSSEGKGTVVRIFLKTGETPQEGENA